MEVDLKPDSEAVAQRAVEILVETSKTAIEERGVFNWAVSGGSTPRRMLELLSETDDLDWSKTHLFQVDERIAPEGSPQRNATMLDEALLTETFLSLNSPAGIHLMPVNASPISQGVADYSDELSAQLGESTVFDLVQLGLGGDGHTASLIPGDPILDEMSSSVGVSQEYQGTKRMSLTRPILDCARVLLWVVAGESKQEAVRQLLERDQAIPGSLLNQEHAVLVLDQAAAG